MTIEFLYDRPLLLVAVAITIVFGAGRLTRVITYDSYPPAAAFRRWWIQSVTRGNGWARLADCFWCMSPWITALAIGTFFLTALAIWVLWVWWLFWGWLALSYAAAIVLAHDEPADSH